MGVSLCQSVKGASACHRVGLSATIFLPRKLGKKDFRCKVASKRGQRTRLRGLCRARATSLRSNNP
ncbi:MAG: hypothetical protein LBQ31_10565 [Bacteroidales bacterium]|nr:hypothetical protein [Bacteroidales bacterium]